MLTLRHIIVNRKMLRGVTRKPVRRWRCRSFSAGVIPVAEENEEFIRLLAKSGWNQARAARELGMTPATVSRYVTKSAAKRIVPSIPVLRLFAERLGENLNLPSETYSATVLKDSPRWLDAWEADAIYMLRRLDPEARKGLIEGLRVIVAAFLKPTKYKVPSMITAGAVAVSMPSGLAQTGALPEAPPGASSSPHVPPSGAPELAPWRRVRKVSSRPPRSRLEHPK